MLTEDYRPGVEGRLSSKTTCFPGKTSRMTWDRGRVSCERLKIIVTAINVSMVLVFYMPADLGRVGERFTGDLALTISSLLVPPLSLACTVQSLIFAGVHRCATKPLTPKSVSHVISPYHITPESKN